MWPKRFNIGHSIEKPPGCNRRDPDEGVPVEQIIRVFLCTVLEPRDLGKVAQGTLWSREIVGVDPLSYLFLSRNNGQRRTGIESHGTWHAIRT